MMKKYSPLLLAVFLALPLTASAETMIAFASDRKLHFFDSAAPETYIKTVDLVGLTASDIMLSAAATTSGELLLLTRIGSSMQLRRINPQTGQIIENTGAGSVYPGSATAFGMDADPRANATGYVVHDADDIRQILTNGASGPKALSYDSVMNDGDPADVNTAANPAVVALAFTNNFRGTETTVAYGIDSTLNTLVLVELDTGRINTIGALGVDTGVRVGFEISGVTGKAYAALSSAAGTFLHNVDLVKGTATQIGRIGPTSGPAGVVILAITSLPPTRVANISTRSRVGNDADVMIAGFIAPGGGDTTRLVIRGIGPSLANAGVASALADPVLQILDGNGNEVATNDNWKSSQQGELTTAGLQPTNDLEAAYIGEFAAGAYTAIVAGRNGETGVGLVEVYQLPP